jgi:hypothetical protein
MPLTLNGGVCQVDCANGTFKTSALSRGTLSVWYKTRLQRQSSPPIMHFIKQVS